MCTLINEILLRKQKRFDIDVSQNVDRSTNTIQTLLSVSSILRSTYFDGKSRAGDRSNRYITATCCTRTQNTTRCCAKSRHRRYVIISRIACRFNRTTQTRKAMPASVWRTRCVIRRQLRALRIAPLVTRVHLLWVKCRRGDCSFLQAVLYISTLFSILASILLSLCLFIPFSLSLSFSLSLTFCLMDVQTRLPQHSSACEMLFPEISIIITSGIFNRLRWRHFYLLFRF